MATKGFICEADINLHLLSTLGNHECPSQFIYLSIEVFGKVHKTKPQHAYYPLVFNETIQLEKTFWSPSNEDEVVDMLEDSQVVIEVRRIDTCFYNGLLLAYYDCTVKDLLFSRYPKIPCSTNGRELYLNRTVDFMGTAPRLRYSAFADVRRIGDGAAGDVVDEKYNSLYCRTTEPYYSPTQTNKDSIYKPVTRQSRSHNRSPSPPYYTRQTVASAIRSRSPSPILNRSGTEHCVEKDHFVSVDSGLGSDKSKEPFVVRKVPDSLIRRNPKLHDSLPKDCSRQGRSRRRQSVSKAAGSNLASAGSNGKRFRSASPSKKLERSLSSVNLSDKIDDKLDSYKPSSFVTGLRSSYDIPHRCYECVGHCHSLSHFGHCGDRFSRFSCCYRSHCCH